MESKYHAINSPPKQVEIDPVYQKAFILKKDRTSSMRSRIVEKYLHELL